MMGTFSFFTLLSSYRMFDNMKYKIFVHWSEEIVYN